MERFGERLALLAVRCDAEAPGSRVLEEPLYRKRREQDGGRKQQEDRALETEGAPIRIGELPGDTARDDEHEDRQHGGRRVDVRLSERRDRHAGDERIPPLLVGAALHAGQAEREKRGDREEREDLRDEWPRNAEG